MYRQSGKIRVPGWAAAALLAVIVAWYAFSDPMVSLNNRMLQKEIRAIPAETAEVALNDIVPFEWDELYTFGPYTSKETIEQTIRLSSKSITETVSEGMVQLIFVDGGREKVVASVCGYPENLGYSFGFADAVWGGEGDGAYCKLTPADNAVFGKTVEDDVVVLTYKK